MVKNETKDSKLKTITNGPGKLCGWLEIDKSFYGTDVVKSRDFWFEDRRTDASPFKIMTGSRVNIDYAGKY